MRREFIIHEQTHQQLPQGPRFDSIHDAEQLFKHHFHVFGGFGKVVGKVDLSILAGTELVDRELWPIAINLDQARRKASRKATAFRKLQSSVANGVRSSLLGDGTPDTGCGIKLFERAVFVELPRFDHMHRFLPALFLRQGARVVSIPVGHRPRTRGTSKYGMLNRLWVGIVDIVGVMWLRRRFKPGLLVRED